MSARQELAKVIQNSGQLGCGCCADRREISTGPEEWDTDYVERDYALADDILEAGYSKPRIVTTVEELDALPDHSVISDNDDDIWQKRGGEWCSYETSRCTSPRLLKYHPLTVLHEGGK